MRETLSHATSRPAEDVSVSSNSKLAGATREPQSQVAQQAVHGTEARVWWTGLFFGVATQVFFLWTAWHLFLFLLNAHSCRWDEFIGSSFILYRSDGFVEIIFVFVCVL